MGEDQPKATGNAPDWARLHLWQIQPVRDLLVLLGVMGVVYCGYLIRVVTVPMLLALLLAYLFEPLVKLLRRRKIASRRSAALGIIFGVFGLIVVPLTFGAGFAVVQGAKAVREITDGVGKVQASINAPADNALRARVPEGAWRWVRDTIVKAEQERAAAVGAAGTTAQSEDEPPSDLNAVVRLALDWLREHGSELGQALGRRVVGGGAQAVGAAFNTVASIGYAAFFAVLTAFFFYFFSTGWGRVLDFGESLLPEASRTRTLELLGRMDRVIAGFVRGRITICFILGVVMTVVYWLAGVPAPLILGPLVGLLFIVPFVHAIGMPIAMLLMWLDPLGPGGTIAGTSAHWGFQREWWWIIAAPIGAYMIAQLLDDWVLTPTIQGKTTDLSIPLILFASLAGGALAGVYGLLIAIPLAACLKILAQELLWPRFRAWAGGQAQDFLPIGRD